MTEEEIRQLMEEGFSKVKPKVGEMTNLLMDIYETGWKNGFGIGVKVGLGNNKNIIRNE